MSFKTKVLKLVSLLLNGKPQIIHANISYIQANNLLLGKKIIITGGGRGLGYAMAKKFISEGAEVLIAGRNEETLKQSAERLECKYLKLDVSNPKEFKAFIDRANEILSGINVLINNAGISLHEQTFFDVTPDTFDQQIDTNLKGAFFLSQEFVKNLKQNS